MEFKEVKLGELVDTISDTTPIKKEKVVLINTSDVENGRVLNHKYVDNKNLRGQFKKRFQKGDILYSEIRPKNKRFAYINFESDDYIASTKLMVLRKKVEINNLFLFQILKSDKIINELQIIAESRSGTFPQITFDEFKSLSVNIPDMEAQAKIVHILSTIDKKIELNNRMNETLHEMAEQQFNMWIKDLINNKETIYGKCCELGKIVMGQSPKGQSYNNNFIGLPLINGAADYQNGYLKAQKFTSNPIKVCNKNDLIFCIRGTIGLLTFCDKKYCLGRGVASIRNIKEDYQEYAYHLIYNSIDIFKKLATGSVIIGISKNDIENIKVKIPDKDQISLFHSIQSPIFKQLENIHQENKSLTKLRDTLLPKLMAGKINLDNLKIKED